MVFVVSALQPLTNFSSEKCKRCGLYEQDTVKPDDVFDEWELCPSDFSESDGRYAWINDKEFNATFLCPECVHLSTGKLQGTPSVFAWCLSIKTS